VSSAGYDRFPDFVNGEVQICLGGRVNSVCDDSWDNQDASVVCNQLGFSPHGEITVQFWRAQLFLSN